jgi:hypothetical protein
MKKQNKTKPVIQARCLRALAQIDLSNVQGGNVSTSPTGHGPKPANPCGN